MTGKCSSLSIHYGVPFIISVVIIRTPREKEQILPLQIAVSLFPWKKQTSLFPIFLRGGGGCSQATMSVLLASVISFPWKS